MARLALTDSDCDQSEFANIPQNTLKIQGIQHASRHKRNATNLLAR